jgi:hypothetical protein
MSEEMTDNILPEIQKTVYLSTNVRKPCSECDGMTFEDRHDIADQIHHYLEHGYILLHIGSETTESDTGGLWHSTVAVMGFRPSSDDKQPDNKAYRFRR